MSVFFEKCHCFETSTEISKSVNILGDSTTAANVISPDLTSLLISQSSSVEKGLPYVNMSLPKYKMLNKHGIFTFVSKGDKWSNSICVMSASSLYSSVLDFFLFHNMH